MKTEQIQYILAIYETGSISKAAKRFYMSRPNLSNSIRNLEQEVGFEILERGTDGVRFTKKGLALVHHGMNILKEIEEIHELAEENLRPHFGIVNPNCPPVEQAFIRLCRHMEQTAGAEKYQLSMYQEHQYEGMKLLNQKKADLAVTVSKDLSAPSLRREMEERRLEYKKLFDVPCNVNLSVHHPLASDPDFCLQKLRDYPFVEYAIESERGSPYNRIGEVGFISLSRLIRVDSGHMRSKVVSETSAYGVGIAMPPSWAEANGFCCIPIPGLTMEMGYIRRREQPESDMELRFLQYLKDEMSFLQI